MLRIPWIIVYNILPVIDLGAPFYWRELRQTKRNETGDKSHQALHSGNTPRIKWLSILAINHINRSHCSFTFW